MPEWIVGGKHGDWPSCRSQAEEALGKEIKIEIGNFLQFIPCKLLQLISNYTVSLPVPQQQTTPTTTKKVGKNIINW